MFWFQEAGFIGFMRSLRGKDQEKVGKRKDELWDFCCVRKMEKPVVALWPDRNTLALTPPSLKKRIFLYNCADVCNTDVYHDSNLALFIINMWTGHFASTYCDITVIESQIYATPSTQPAVPGDRQLQLLCTSHPKLFLIVPVFFLITFVNKNHKCTITIL